VRLWDVAPGQQIRQLGGAHQPTIQSVAFSPDGKTAVTSAEDGTLGVWDVDSGQRTRSTTITDDPASISNLVVSPDGSQAYFYTNAGDLSIWDVSSGTEISRTKGFEGDSSGPSHVAISPDGNQMLYATSFFSTTTVFYYDWNTAEQRELTGHSADITSLAFGPDGKTAVSGSRDRTLRLWDLASGSTIKIFSGHARAVTSVAFSPDGKTIISGSDDRTIRLWDVETGQEKLRLVGHSGPVTSVALSPDGRSLLSGSADGTLRLWRVDTLDELTAWVRANRDVPLLSCSVNTDYNLTIPVECVNAATPTATGAQ
jgi:WD40 repeat protein